ncbi:MAG TPA: magnesium transporter CorA family protein [Patescibacteria group bacterium]|nr:magnesium transporter CorA family protein [Patescibacteria group bacterium]
MSYTTITYKKNGNNIEWIDIVQPTKKDIQRIESEYALQHIDASDALQPTTHLKVTRRETYLFLAALFPLYHEKTKTISTEEIDFFIGSNFLITIHEGRLPLFQKLVQHCQQQEEQRNLLFSNHVEHLFFQLLNHLLDSVYPLIDSVNAQLFELERKIFGGHTMKNLVTDILILRRNITDIRRAMRNYSTIIRHILNQEDGEKVMQFTKYHLRLEELIDSANEIWGMLESNKETIEALEDANDALISHTLNNVMKTLTAASVVLLPMGVLAGIFGMNARHIPFVGHPLDFWIITTLLFCVSSGIIFLFWKKRWLQ